MSLRTLLAHAHASCLLVCQRLCGRTRAQTWPSTASRSADGTSTAAASSRLRRTRSQTQRSSRRVRRRTHDGRDLLQQSSGLRLTRVLCVPVLLVQVRLGRSDGDRRGCLRHRRRQSQQVRATAATRMERASVATPAAQQRTAATVGRRALGRSAIVAAVEARSLARRRTSNSNSTNSLDSDVCLASRADRRQRQQQRQRRSSRRSTSLTTTLVRA